MPLFHILRGISAYIGTGKKHIAFQTVSAWVKSSGTSQHTGDTGTVVRIQQGNFAAGWQRKTVNKQHFINVLFAVPVPYPYRIFRHGHNPDRTGLIIKTFGSPRISCKKFFCHTFLSPCVNSHSLTKVQFREVKLLIPNRH